MKNHDQDIICHLRTNARMSLTTMSKKTDIPITTIHHKIKEMNKTVIIKHVSLLNFHRLGYLAHAMIIIQSRKPNKEALTQFLQHHPHVNTLLKINNGFDFIAEVVFEQMLGLEDFLEELRQKHLVKSQVYYILDSITQETFLEQSPYTSL